MKVSYNWLQNYFEEKLPDPEKIADGIIFHSFEVEEIEKKGDDTIFDIKILPDRAHDCLSHWGIAKEVSAIFNLKIKEANAESFEKKITGLKIEVADEKCLRYMGRILRNVKVEPSPDWLKKKLESIGQRSINNVVDAANFVMFDLGQPIHAFDLDKMASSKIVVRNAKDGEKVTTLDKKNIDLKDDILVIADENDPLAIAGIKGGTKTEVDLNTKNIVIEVANFDATTTRKTAKKINILTDAVKRYENEITPELCEKTMNAITSMIVSLAGGEVEDIVDIYPKQMVQKNVSVSVDYINKRLGANFKKEEIKSVWEKLGFDYIEDNDVFNVKVPLMRLDITGPHDLTEEVIRILGYDRLEEKLPEIKFQAKKDGLYYKMLATRNKLLKDGYSEIMTYVFQDKGDLEVLASASDKNFLRNNLTDGLKQSLKLNKINAPLLEMNEIKIFEIGTVFKKSGEEMHVAYGDKKEIKEVSLDEFYKNISDIDISFGEISNTSIFKMWSLYPFISRDIAVWVKEGEDKVELQKLLEENATELCVKKPYLFDSFTKDGRTSYAFRLVFQSYDRTLTDEEVNTIMAKISHKINENSSWQIR